MFFYHINHREEDLNPFNKYDDTLLLRLITYNKNEHARCETFPSSFVMFESNESESDDISITNQDIQSQLGRSTPENIIKIL